MEFQRVLEQKTQQAEELVLSYLPKEKPYPGIPGRAPDATLIEAMDYSVRSGGKRLRPILMQEAFRMFGGHSRLVEPFMAALEMIHSYSLVHDDLPEMDNDKLRRGKPTTHVQYGQAMAVLAGDALLNYAYETAAGAFGLCKEPAETANCIRALGILAKNAGIYGMVGGQGLDVEAEKKGLELSYEQIAYVNENKTARLIQAGLMMGCALAGGSEEEVAIMEKAGYDLGIAFQLQDDILDVTGTTETLGKTVGSDEKNGKKTYMSFYGMEATVEEKNRLSEEAISIVNELKIRGEADAAEAKGFLLELMRHLTDRKK